MPDPRNPSPKALRSPDTVEVLVDDDPVNKDNLYVELAPGGTPKLTLGYLHDLIAKLNLGTTTGTSVVRPAESLIQYDPTGANTLVLEATNVANGKVAWHAFKPPDGAHVAKVTVYVTPGHTPPAGVKVSALIGRHTIADDTNTTIGAATVDPATGAGYSAAHGFDVPISAGSGPGGTTETVDATKYLYSIQWIGETGTGAGLVLFSGSTFTYTL